MTKNTTIVVNERFEVAGKVFAKGEVYSVFVAAKEKAAALLVKHGKNGKPLDHWNMRNVRSLHVNESKHFAAGGFFSVI